MFAIFQWRNKVCSTESKPLYLYQMRSSSSKSKEVKGYVIRIESRAIEKYMPKWKIRLVSSKGQERIVFARCKSIQFQLKWYRESVLHRKGQMTMLPIESIVEVMFDMELYAVE